MTDRALVIGSARYRDGSGIDSYDEIDASASLYKKVLTEKQGWDPAAVTLLSREHPPQTVNDVMDAVEDAAGAGRDEEDDTLLVVYVGHGMHWPDVPGSQVHFAVGSSMAGRPHTWLSAWYVYHAMRASKATRKLLIADCCYSNFLPKLGGSGGSSNRDALNTRFRDALGKPPQGSCVLAATKDNVYASPTSCENLPDQFQNCTPFSGHLLKILSAGTNFGDDELTLQVIRDALVAEMNSCGTHAEPDMIFTGSAEKSMFRNHKSQSERFTGPPPSTVDDWVTLFGTRELRDFAGLLSDPVKAGQVVARILSQSSSLTARANALRVTRSADEQFRDADEFARYWDEAERALTA